MKLNLKPVERMLGDLMVDECLIRYGPQRRGHGTFNDTTGTYDEPDQLYIYHGPCMVTKQGLLPYTDRRGGAEIQVSYYTVRIPLQPIPPDIQDDDELEVTFVHPDGDPALLGKMFTIRAMDDATYSVCHEVRAILQREVPA